MTRKTFTDADRQRFAALKAELRQGLQRNVCDSESIYKSSQRLLEIRDHSFHEMDDEEDCEIWADKVVGIGQHQVKKYYNIGTNLTREEVKGKTQGVESMNQIAIAPRMVRPTMWEVAEEEHLSTGALAAGRLAALPHARWKQDKRAVRELLKAARRQAEKERQESERRKAEPTPVPELIQRGLGREAARLEKYLDRGQKLEADEVTGIRAEIARLEGLGQRLAMLQEDAAVGTFEKSGSAKGQESRGVVMTGTFETSASAKSQGSPGVAAAGTFETSASAKSQGSPDVAGPHPESPSDGAVALNIADFLQVARTAGSQLGPGAGAELRELLGRIVRGDRPRRVMPALRACLQDFLSGAATGTDLLEQGLKRLEAPDWVERGTFALEWLVAARLPGYEQKLKVLSLLDMPAELKARVDRWRKQVCGTPAAPVTGAAAPPA